MYRAASETEEDEEELPYNRQPYNPQSSPSRQNYKHAPKLSSLKSAPSYGKSSYPSYKSERNPSAEGYYPGAYPKQSDVEVFLPKDKLITLPMVNGKPKPYDGYRAATEIRHRDDDYESDDADDDDEDDSSGKYSEEGEIIYGKPKPGPHNIVPPYTPPRGHRIKRSPAEYHGGIYPHFDYSDPKHTKQGNVESEETNKQKKAYPKKHQPEVSPKAYDQYKYPNKNKKVSKSKDNYGHATENNPEVEEQNEEQEEEAEEQEQEQEEEQEDPANKIPPIKYTYDNTFHIPELKVKKYPYERFLKIPGDSKKAGSNDNSRYSNYDEYTEDYEKYKSTLPSDLEKYFGSSEIEDKYTVAATQNLEKDKNCEKVAKAPAAAESADGKVKREAESDNQVCYICRDPKTGGSYEQCAYQTDPKSEKFFYGGSSSYQTNEKKDPVTYKYRNRRSPYEDHFSNLEHFIFGEPHARRIARGDIDYVPKPKKVNRKKYKKSPNPKRNPKYKHNGPYKKYDPLAKIIGAPSTYADESARVEGPPESYNGPAYTYEGPSRPYEGPKVTYEGPAVPYEGPAEPYEGPVNQEYYDTTDDRLEDDEYHPPKQDYQGTSPKYYNEYQSAKPPKAQSYSVKHTKPIRGPKSEVEEFQGGNFRVGDGYIADYRFGPEVFDEEESEPTRRNEEIKVPKKVKSTEKRGPHKFSNGDEKTSASTESEDTEEFIGHVRVYKNGDVCQKKKKEGMICMVCKNEKTSASYEQCQYSSKPKDKYFTFGSQKSYSSSKAPSDRHERNADSDQYPEKSDIIEKKILITKESKVFGDDTEGPESLVGAESNNYDRFRDFLLSGDLVGAFSDNSETRVEDPEQESDEEGNGNRKSTESVERIEPRDEVEGLDEFLYGGQDNEKKATEEQEGGYKSYDDYFHALFPEFAKSAGYTEEGDSDKEGFDPFENIRAFKEDAPEEQEEISPVDISDSPKSAEASNEEPLRLKDQSSRIPEEFYESYSEDHKKDLEKALGEFQNRDWSNCKKIVKKKLTCYQCVDKNGVSNEECMYVEASQPVSKHLAYHEEKKLRPPVQPNNDEEESQKNEQTAAAATDLTAEPNKTDDEVFRRIRKPKNARPDVIEVTETPQESVNSEQYAPQKGDLEGVRRVTVEEVTFTTTATTTYETEPETTTQKPRIKKNKKNQKKRIKYTKTDGNETTTEAARKRKYPIKKFSENDRTAQNEDFVNQNAEETTRNLNEDDGSVVKIFFNNTEGSTR